MHVIFFHGRGSHPNAQKNVALGKVAKEAPYNNCTVWNTAFPDHSSTDKPNERVEMALQAHRDILTSKTEYNDVVLVGSSMGGYVATVLANRFPVRGLFLMAPALYMKDFSVQDYKPMTTRCVVVHGTKDEIVPVENSRRFCKSTGATLLEVEDDHRLHASIPEIEKVFREFCKNVRQDYSADMAAL